MRDFSSIMKEYVSSIKENMDTIEPVSRVYADVNANKDRSYWDYRNYKIKYHDNSRYKVSKSPNDVVTPCRCLVSDREKASSYFFRFINGLF